MLASRQISVIIGIAEEPTAYSQWKKTDWGVRIWSGLSLQKVVIYNYAVYSQVLNNIKKTNPSRISVFLKSAAGDFSHVFSHFVIKNMLSGYIE